MHPKYFSKEYKGSEPPPLRNQPDPISGAAFCNGLTWQNIVADPVNPPPAEQLQELLSSMSLRESRRTAIRSQDGGGYEDWVYGTLNLKRDDTPRAIVTLVGSALSDIKGLVLRGLKPTYDLARPYHFDKTLGPFVAVGEPNHASFPAGHAAESLLMTLVLKDMIKGDPEYHRFALALEAMAASIRENREIAGLHTRQDTIAGLEVASKVHEYILKQGPYVGDFLPPAQEAWRELRGYQSDKNDAVGLQPEN